MPAAVDRFLVPKARPLSLRLNHHHARRSRPIPRPEGQALVPNHGLGVLVLFNGLDLPPLNNFPALLGRVVGGEVGGGVVGRACIEAMKPFELEETSVGESAAIATSLYMTFSANMFTSSLLLTPSPRS